MSAGKSKTMSVLKSLFMSKADRAFMIFISLFRYELFSITDIFQATGQFY